MEKKMETTIVYWGCIRNHGKENGNYYTIIDFYRDNGKEIGNYYIV